MICMKQCKKHAVHCYFKIAIWISSYLFVSTRSNWNLALRQTLRNSLAASSGISGISRRSSILSLSPDRTERESSAISGLMLSDPSSISTTTKPPTWSEEIPQLQNHKLLLEYMKCNLMSQTFKSWQLILVNSILLISEIFWDIKLFFCYLNTMNYMIELQHTKHSQYFILHMLLLKFTIFHKGSRLLIGHEAPRMKDFYQFYLYKIVIIDIL